ncbi:MAG: tetratricopeptide repeat protein [Pyrinomonadaceae bacterium]
MNCRKRIAPVLFLMMLLTSVSAVAQQNNEIMGRVLDQNNRAVKQVYIELLNEVNSVVARARTDDSGSYRFGRLSYGRFVLRVAPTGQDFSETSVDIYFASPFGGVRAAPETIYQDVYVRRRSEVTPAGGVVFTQEVPKNASELYDAAIKNIADKDSAKATENLEKAVIIFPDYFDALEQLAKLKNTEQKYVEAIDLYERALKINPRASVSWYGLAFANLATNKTKDAVKAARQAVSFSPETYEFHFVLGLALRKMGDFDSAEKSLLKADELSNQKLADISWNLALLYGNNLKQYANAANRLEKYLKLAGKIPNQKDIVRLIKHFRELAARS